MSDQTDEELYIYIGEKKLIEFIGAKDGISGEPRNDLAMTFDVYDSANARIGSADQTMTYVPASDGDYRGTLSNTDTLTMVLGSTVYVVEKSSDGTVYRRIPYPVKYRGRKNAQT